MRFRLVRTGKTYGEVARGISQADERKEHHGRCPVIWKGTLDEYRAMLVLKEAELIVAKAQLTGNRYCDLSITTAILCLEADMTDLRRWLGRTASETKTSETEEGRAE
jgi:hypothetical protein